MTWRWLGAVLAVTGGAVLLVYGFGALFAAPVWVVDAAVVLVGAAGGLRIAVRQESTGRR